MIKSLVDPDNSKVASSDEDIRSTIKTLDPNDMLIWCTSIKDEYAYTVGDYKGVRVKIPGTLTAMRVHVQVDIGFGDAIYPHPEIKEFPTVLDQPASRLTCYCKETLIAEKFHAMVELGKDNSRMKDFYDIWLLSRRFDFDGSELATALKNTFHNRGTEIKVAPVALKVEFTASDENQKKWSAFLRRSNLNGAPVTLEKIREPLCQFLLPVASAIKKDEYFNQLWSAPGPWKDKEKRI